MPDLVDAVAESFLAQVQVLMETVRQMDTALQRRSKLRASATFSSDQSPMASMSDSDKITLQLLLDADAFEKEVLQLVGFARLPNACKLLLEELADARRFLPAR